MAKRIHHFAGIPTESTTQNVVAPYYSTFPDTLKISKKLEQWRLYSCSLDLQVIDDTALLQTSLAGDDEKKLQPKRTPMKKKKKKKKKHFVYSREEIEALRFQNLDDQKKKWAAVYRRLRPAVAAEYSGLVDHRRTPLLP